VKEAILLLLGSMSGCTLSAFLFAVFHSRKVVEMTDTFMSVRETIRRNAYSKGYEDAKTGEVKRA
jgi:hypothetical protein